MVTLTEIAYYARKGLIFGSIGLVIIIAGFMTIMTTLENIKEEVPVPTPAPSASFGPLPPIVFPANNVYPTLFDLQLIEGRPPEGTPSAQIYFVPQKAPTLFSRRNATQFAQKLGFSADPGAETDTQYSYEDTETGNALTVDITNNNFLFKKNYIDPAVFEEATQTDELTVTNVARSYFLSLGTPVPQPLNIPLVSYLRFEGSRLVPTARQNEAQAVRVDFLPGPLNEKTVLTPSITQSGVFLVFTATRERITNVFQTSFQYHPPELTASSTYPTISGQTAWDQLIAGNGFIARPPQIGTEAIVRDVYLAYYQPLDYQPYLQLVWVLEGDHDFMGMVPALDPTWIGQ